MTTIYSSRQGDAPSTAVIEATADLHRVDPADLEQPLYEVIDPDALDKLVADTAADNGQPSISVQFTYDGCLVNVSSDGSVEVSRNEAE